MIQLHRSRETGFLALSDQVAYPFQWDHLLALRTILCEMPSQVSEGFGDGIWQVEICPTCIRLSYQTHWTVELPLSSIEVLKKTLYVGDILMGQVEVVQEIVEITGREVKRQRVREKIAAGDLFAFSMGQDTRNWLIPRSAAMSLYGAV